MRKTASTPPTAPGVIARGECYSLSEFRSRLRLGSKGVAAMRRAGLPIRRFGRQGYVMGDDALKFLAGLPTESGAIAGFDNT